MRGALWHLFVPESGRGVREKLLQSGVIVCTQEVHVVLSEDLEKILIAQLHARHLLNLRESNLGPVEVHRRDLSSLNQIIEHVIPCHQRPLFVNRTAVYYSFNIP